MSASRAASAPGVDRTLAALAEPDAMWARQLRALQAHLQKTRP